MKKEKLLVFVFMLVVVVGLSFVSGAIKTNKDSYNNGDPVYLISTSDPLCYLDLEVVKAFVVEDREWTGGEVLNDARGDSSEVPNKRFNREQLLEDAVIGNFDVVIDCNDNGIYDSGEPIFDSGFEVVAKKGVGRVLDGLLIEDFSWNYDPEEIDLEVEILQVKISVANEGVKLSSLDMAFNNIPSLNLQSVEIYVDNNGDAKLDGEDVKIGEYVPEGVISNRESAEVILDYVLNDDVEKSLLVVYRLKEDVDNGKYSIRLNSLLGVGEITGENISFLGLSKESSVLTVVDAKSCLGALALELDPSSSYENAVVNAKVSNLNGCDGFKVSLRDQPCYLPVRDVASCVVKDGKCEGEVITSGSKTYYACLDKNKDDDFVDTGESVPAEYEFLVKEVEVVEEDEEEDEEGVEGENGEGNEGEGNGGGITGGVVNEGGFAGNLVNNDSFLVLLEVTLLLILFVLVMILFKLGGNARVSGGESDVQGLLDDDDEDEMEEKKDKSDKKGNGKDDKDKKKEDDKKDIGDLFDEDEEGDDKDN
tara:strand:- start:8502 stop:10109 length:1608 start_codon:yes stop_codon:yes gene_type:complete